MSTYKSFQDSKVWQDSRKLNKEIFTILESKNNSNLGYLTNHIFKTAGSVMDNIAEGFEREGNKELIQFLYFSKGSAGELQSQLIRAVDFGVIEETEFNQLNSNLIHILQQLSNFISYLKRSELKGNKYKVELK